MQISDRQLFFYRAVLNHNSALETIVYYVQKYENNLVKRMAQNHSGNDVEKSASHLLEIALHQEEQEREVKERKQKMEEVIEAKMKELTELEMEKTKLEAEIMSLKLQDTAYQREHLNLRNAITIIRFRIEKIKESIEKTKRSELEELKEFERAVDEITENFRSSPAIYDRRSLSQKLNEEREKRKLLLENLKGIRESYANFNKEKGLRERSNEEEELLNCALPGSELYSLMEMTKNLDEVIHFMKHRSKNLKQNEEELKKLTADLTELTSKVTATNIHPKNNDSEN